MLGPCCNCRLSVFDPEETNHREAEGFTRDDGQAQHFGCLRWARLMELSAKVHTASHRLNLAKNGRPLSNPRPLQASMSDLIAACAEFIEAAE